MEDFRLRLLDYRQEPWGVIEAFCVIFLHFENHGSWLTSDNSRLEDFFHVLVGVPFRVVRLDVGR